MLHCSHCEKRTGEAGRSTAMAHEHYQACIDACNACATACNHCAAACLREDGIADLRECIRLDLDCAQICGFAAAYMARGSEFAPDACALCADVCDACAEECERHDMAHCRECAAACRRCADECRRMAGSAAGQRTAHRAPHASA
jgi:hypothetical protein